jgi:hypothetical protein
MAKEIINVGANPNDRSGDSLRAAFSKVNANFTELYTQLGLNNDINLNLGAFEFNGSTLTTTDSSAIIIDQATTVTSDLTVGGDILPSGNLRSTLGSPEKKFHSLYVGTGSVYIGDARLSLEGGTLNSSVGFSTDNLTVGGVNISVNENGALLSSGGFVGAVSGAVDWANILNKPTIPTSFDSLVNGDHQLELIVNGEIPYVNFPALNEANVIIQGNEISVFGNETTLSSAENGVKLSANTTGSRKNWTFGTDGSLTIPGDIRSENAINIDINLSDSTLRRWSFGEDGALTLPEGGRINALGYNNIVRLGNDGLMVANGSIFNENESGLSIEGQNSDAGTYITIPGRTASENGYPLIISHNWDAAIEIQGGGGTWSFGFDGNLTIPGNIRSEGNVDIEINLSDSTLRRWSFGEDGNLNIPGDILDSTGVSQTAQREEGSWTVTAGTNTYSFTLPSDGTYTMWVKGNIPNGIIVWNATASVSNTNVPAIGTQYAWNYTGGGSPISLTSIPDQIKGTAGTISTDATYAGTTSNRFDFGISNTSSESQTVYYGYTKI